MIPAIQLSSDSTSFHDQIKIVFCERIKAQCAVVRSAVLCVINCRVNIDATNVLMASVCGVCVQDIDTTNVLMACPCVVCVYTFCLFVWNKMSCRIIFFLT